MQKIENSVLFLVSSLLSLKTIGSILAFGALVLASFGVLWTAFEAAGSSGGPAVFFLVLLLSLVTSSLIPLLRLFRWNLIYWAIGSNIEPIIRFDPSVVIGLGYGGGILAGIICKRITERTRKEPMYYVIDRTIGQDRKRRYVNIGDISEATAREIKETHANVLLVTGEVHTGTTLAMASDYLDSLEIAHKTFALLVSPRPEIAVDFYVVRTYSRSLLPWPHAPADTDMHTTTSEEAN